MIIPIEPDREVCVTSDSEERARLMLLALELPDDLPLLDLCWAEENVAVWKFELPQEVI